MLREDGIAVNWTTDGPLEIGVVLARVEEVLATHQLCILGTHEEQGPRMTPCFFAPMSGPRLVFVSSTSARHITNIEADSRSSALIVDSPGSGERRLVSLQMTGTVHGATGTERLKAAAIYAKHQAARLPGAAKAADLGSKRVFILQPHSIELLDTDLHRQTIRLQMSPR
ncbi:pyridoxamine 5'-phosphate oxidase family protein [Actinomyces slackii]|uniref:Uncharacterized protein conserved in bacteria n=1 Tax=Actinomyces slackii TaxID=52774 RepID=A0A448KAE8_9ACTO|nr:Uncharacterized protein conserved in bacteria [Actinomyces slackii]